MVLMVQQWKLFYLGFDALDFFLLNKVLIVNLLLVTTLGSSTKYSVV